MSQTRNDTTNFLLLLASSFTREYDQPHHTPSNPRVSLPTHPRDYKKAMRGQYGAHRLSMNVTSLSLYKLKRFNISLTPLFLFSPSNGMSKHVYIRVMGSNSQDLHN